MIAPTLGIMCEHILEIQARDCVKPARGAASKGLTGTLLRFQCSFFPCLEFIRLIIEYDGADQV